MFKKRDMLLFIVLLVGGVVAVSFFLVHPSLQSVRDTLAFSIILKMIPTGLLLYFAWIAKCRPPKAGQIIMTLMASVPWQGFLFSSTRLVVLNATVLTFVGIGYLLFINVMQDKNNKPLCYATAMLSLVLLLQMQYYSYLDGKTHFWIVSLVLASLAGIAVYCLIHRGLNWLLDEDTILERISVCFIVTAIVFVLSWSTANNMNYFLDFSEPEEYCMTIVDKQMRSSRSGTYYELVLVYNENEVTLGVSQSTYFQNEIGDVFSVALYQGFWGEPYYIADE